MKVNIFILILSSLLLNNGYKTKLVLDEKINKVTYKVDLYIDPIKDSIKKNQFKEKMDLLEYELFYNSSTSLFIPVEKMNSENEDFKLKIVKNVAGGMCLKNIHTKEKITQKYSYGELFNVVKDFEEFKWEITTETKIINGYKCFKATTYKEEYDPTRNITRKFHPAVWFAPEIPAPFGPKGLDGLPGLVLEGTYNGKMYFYATKIEFDCNTKIKLEKSSKGRYVNEIEFLKIDAENFKKSKE